jgi:predicted AAA+ superfamily ATPase
MTPSHYNRFLLPRLEETLSDSPVLLIHGPRQCGKTTLAKEIGEKRGYGYLTFDDDTLVVSARQDPVGFVESLADRTILDEVQRVPEIFTSLKASIDRDRKPGRFILTGSANVLLVPTLSDSLAGRMAIVRLHPLAQAELEQRSPRILGTHFGPHSSGSATPTERLGDELAERITAGGYPAALARASARRRAAWYRDYLEALVQRDVRDLTRISSLEVLPRLLALAAGQTARLLNVTDLAAPFQLSRPTIRQYVTLLSAIFLLEELPPWHTNRLSRLVKTAKLHIGDTGLGCALLGIDARALASDRNLLGQFLETFVYQELRRQASWEEDPITFHHFRDRDGVEVDIVLERGSRQIAGVEVKAAASVNAGDFRGLRKLSEAAGERFSAGIVLYDGRHAVPFGNKLFAIPVRALWES